ncbi:MAG: glycerophosphodiester phosphodiesterase [Odoribacter sp.]|nr:glycerophosphodiester phosphodiesterase [Odoribacter sp.]
MKVKILRTLLFIMTVLPMGLTAQTQTKVIAHRGFWDKAESAQNSIANLKFAAEAGCYGSEFDVNLTKDNQLVVAHGPNHGKGTNRLVIQNSTLEELRKIKLENGEEIPTLDEYLEEGKKHKNLKLILEIKSHDTPQRETEAVEHILKAVKANGMEEQIEYIAFSKHVCMELLRLNPNASVSYLNGDIEPEELKQLGCEGLDYNYKTLMKNPEWIERAGNIGLTVNTWTVNEEKDMRWFVERKADFITTDKPELLKKILNE